MGREEIFIDLRDGAPKKPLCKNDSNSEFHCLRPLRRPCWVACGPLTLSEAQGSWGHGPVHECGLQIGVHGGSTGAARPRRALHARAPVAASVFWVALVQQT